MRSKLNPQGIKIDVTFDGDTSDSHLPHMGIQCCDLIKRLLHQHPYIEPVILVLKKFLATRNLNSPYLGGLSSYGLIILMVAFLNSDPLSL